MIDIVKAGDFIESTETIIKQGAFKQKNSLFSSWKVHSYMFDGNCIYRVKHHPSSTSGKVEVREVFPLNTTSNMERYDIVVTQIISSDDMTGKKNTIGFFFDENPYKKMMNSLSSTLPSNKLTKIEDENAAKIIEEMDEFLNEKPSFNNTNINTNTNNNTNDNTNAMMIDKKKLSPRFLMATSAEEKKLWMNLLNQYLQKKPPQFNSMNGGSSVGGGSVGSGVGGSYSESLNQQGTTPQANAILSTIEAMIDIVIVSDAYGTVTAYNTQAESFFGYKKKDVIGKDIKILMPFEVAKNHDEFMQRFRKTGNKHLIGKPRALPAKLFNGQVAEVRLSLGEIPGSTDRDKYRFMAVMRRQTPKTTPTSTPQQGNSPISSQIPSNIISPNNCSSTATTTAINSGASSSSVVGGVGNNRSGNRLMSPSTTTTASSPHSMDAGDVFIQQRLNVPYSVDEVKVSKSGEINQEIFQAHHHIYDLYKSIHGTLNKYGQSVNSSFKKDYSSLEKKFHMLEEKMKHLEKSNSHMLANIHHQKKVIDFLEQKTDSLYKEKKETRNGRYPTPTLTSTTTTSPSLFNTPLQKTSGPKYKAVPTDTTLLDVIGKGVSHTDLTTTLSPRSNNFMTSLANIAGAEQSEFKDVLQNDYALKYFMKFASKELSLENVKLYIYLTRFYLPEARVDLKKSKIMRQYVIDTFIVHGSPFEVNLSSTQRKKLLDKYYKLRDYEMEKEREEKQYMEDYIHRTSYHPQHRKASTHSNGDEEDTLSDGSESSEMEALFLENENQLGKYKSKNSSVSSNGSSDENYGSNVLSEGSNSSSTDNTEEDLATVHDVDEEGLEDMSFHEDHTFLKSNRRKSDSYLQSEILDQAVKSSPTLATLMYDLEEGEKFFDDLLVQVKGVMMDTYSRFLRSEEYKEMKEEVRRVHKAEMEIVKLKLSSTMEK